MDNISENVDVSKLKLERFKVIKMHTNDNIMFIIMGLVGNKYVGSVKFKNFSNYHFIIYSSILCFCNNIDNCH